jgi:hypothetical protein
MTADDFLQAHAKWLYGANIPDKEPEEPHTWFMSKSGHYFQFTDRKVFDSELAKGMFCVFLNATSLTMRAEQGVVLGSRK